MRSMPEKKFKEGKMARKWEIEKEKIGSDTFEGALIEVFGCTSLDNTVIKLFTGKDRIKSDFYINGNVMEAALIETYGCISLDKVIGLDLNRGKEVVRFPETVRETEALVVGLD